MKNLHLSQSHTMSLPVPPHNWQHITALYEDESVTRIGILVCGDFLTVDICPDSAEAIKAAMLQDTAVAKREGYPDNPNAFTHWLTPNNYGRLLTVAEERKEMYLSACALQQKHLGGRVIRHTLGRPSRHDEGNRTSGARNQSVRLLGRR